MSQNILKKFKNKLSQNGDNLTEYNNVIKEHLKTVSLKRKKVQVSQGKFCI